MKITLVAGTNRPQSMTRRVTQHIHSELTQLLSGQNSIETVDLLDLPSDAFLPKSYAAKPPSFAAFENLMLHTDGILFVIPEYNGGAPGALKYFIDLLPFPQCLKGKPCSFVGLSSGRFGALRAVEQIEAVCHYRNAILFPERTFIPFAEKALTTDGVPIDEGTKKVLRQQLEHFVAFVKKLS